MEQVRAQLQDLDVTITEQTATHRSELTRQDELMSKYTSDIRTLEDRFKQSQLQVISLFDNYMHSLKNI